MFDTLMPDPKNEKFFVSSEEFLTSKDAILETKYKVCMRLAERWATEAFQRKMTPEDFCAEKFRNYQTFKDKAWTDLTRMILTAFVIREHQVIVDFLK